MFLATSWINKALSQAFVCQQTKGAYSNSCNRETTGCLVISHGSGAVILEVIMVVFVVVIESWSYPESVTWKQLPNWSETGLKRVWNHRKRPFASPPPTYIERFRDGEPEGVSEWFQTGFRPFWGRSRGFALFLEKRLNLMLRQWNQNKKINTSFLQLKTEIKQWCCNRRSKVRSSSSSNGRSSSSST